MIPYRVNEVCFTLKDSAIMFFPNIPYEETGDELPESVENGVLKRMSMPVLDGVCNVALLFVSSSVE